MAESADISHFSIGGAYRDLASKSTDLGRLVKQHIEKGLIVPWTVALKVIKMSLAASGRSAIIDGFPRTIEQARTFDKMLEEANARLFRVIEIRIGREVAFERITQRNRGIDDAQELFQDRFGLYEKDIEKIRSHYQEKKLYTAIDGDTEIENVYASFCELIP